MDFKLHATFHIFLLISMGFLLLPVPSDPSSAPFLLQDKVLPSQGEQMVPDPSTISNIPWSETLARPQPLGLFHQVWMCVQFLPSTGTRLRLDMNLNFSKQVFFGAAGFSVRRALNSPQCPPCGFPAPSPYPIPPKQCLPQLLYLCPGHVDPCVLF